ncbi:MAG: hypothetical protein ACUVSY_04930 [Roseiflexus sp.]
MNVQSARPSGSGFPRRVVAPASPEAIPVHPGGARPWLPVA